MSNIWIMERLEEWYTLWCCNRIYTWSFKHSCLNFTAYFFGFTFVTKCVELGKDLVCFIFFDIGDVYSKIPLKSVKSEVFDKLEEVTRTFLMDNLINKFNLLLNETWTPSSMCIYYFTWIFFIFRKASVCYYKVLYWNKQNKVVYFISV